MKSKRCPRCEQTKPASAFAKHSRRKDGLQAHCKECVKEGNQKYYQANKERFRDSVTATRRRIAKEIGIYIWNYLAEHPCVDCGESDPVVLEFDHVDEKNKVAEVSRLAAQRRPLAVIATEIEKCVVRCANCHRRRTAAQFGWYSYVTGS